MSVEEIEKAFPNLRVSGYSITSPVTPEYNCIAWAAGETESWWEPDPLSLYYWPSNTPRQYTAEAYKKAYEKIGYAVCNNPAYEEGFEKIAVYVDSHGKPTHAARQLSAGIWTSKLGSLEDIEHVTLDDLTGFSYGIVGFIMKRQRKE
ncbi:MAG: hypothetical protein DYG84_08245 [Candidatus Brocadia sp. AMX3]|jgi:hypothetical protein|nr:hypothetical protein [Candidatus Brocadia fulgida]MCE7911710.1 hypothetical protein [Candidatus Brocadia sp. AMX3]MDG5995690.1 hypothetical protein [Candidatus Brocadia sp.]OQZ01722.1 MAG: hypothetical protein B6D35_02430 [Candidatus Brocadia sp. UTAMX2]